MTNTRVKIIAALSSIAIIMFIILMISVSNGRSNNGVTVNPVTNQETTAKKDAKNKVDKNDELLTLVNYKHPVPDNYKINLVDTENDLQIDKRAAKALKDMLDDCRKAGYEPYMRSAYRTIATQKALFDKKKRYYKNQGLSDSEAEKKTAGWIAYPGTSEHNLGLAVDVVDENYRELDETQEEQPTQQWLMQNSWKYGFILRYPTDKKAITHINYEPWHYRYVGKENAKKIKESDLCLEEYLDMT